MTVLNGANVSVTLDGNETIVNLAGPQKSQWMYSKAGLDETSPHTLQLYMLPQTREWERANPGDTA